MSMTKPNKLFMTAVIITALLCLSPLASYGFEGLGLEEANSVERLSESAMDNIRGRYYGFYFSINFTGYWDTIGSTPMATLTYDAGLGQSLASGSINLIDSSSDDEDGESGSISSRNVAVNTSATIGGGGSGLLNGASGAFQLTQVPGNMNFVYSGIVINLSIFNIKDTAAGDLRSVLSSVVGGPF